jgi:RNA ligase
MNNFEKINWSTIDKYYDEGLLMVNKHPTKALWILNYTQKVQFERLWDATTMACRGLIVDTNGNVVARPFEKFFNIEEHENCDFLSPVPKDISFQTFEKMDGSLGILFNHKGSWVFASRGSFESEQAQVGWEILNEKGKIDPIDVTKKSLWDVLSPTNTYIFEIIYPENRIVVDYGKKRDVVLLGVIETKTGKEMTYGDMKSTYDQYFTIVPRYDGIGELDKIKDVQNDNKEGYVLRFGNGLRVKVKFDEYVRLHKIVTNISNKDVWNHLKEGLSFDKMLEKVPDEFFDWVKKTRAELENQYNDIEVESLRLFLKVYNELGASIMIKKEFALKVKDTEYASILFNMYDGKDYSNMIWKMIKPKWCKPFKDGVDDA